jgi:hypothetical protein
LTQKAKNLLYTTSGRIKEAIARKGKGCVIVALQGCVIVALQGCVIVALQGCVIVALQGCVTQINLAKLLCINCGCDQISADKKCTTLPYTAVQCSVQDLAHCNSEGESR